MVPRVARDFSGIRVDTTDWPIILMVMPEHRVTDADVQSALGHIEQMMLECKKSREKCVQVTDASAMTTLPLPSQRKMTGEWIKKTIQLQREVSLGGANVTPSAIIRGMITAIHWFRKPETPVVFVATRQEGFLQAFRWFEEAKVPLPPHLRKMRDELSARRERYAGGPGSRR
ncbi:MAG TPA: hypothetical protein VGL81_12780 [Polyangiaceae bacterium]|jgi:hypothetical protein